MANGRRTIDTLSRERAIAKVDPKIYDAYVGSIEILVVGFLRS